MHYIDQMWQLKVKNVILNKGCSFELSPKNPEKNDQYVKTVFDIVSWAAN